MKEFPLSKVEPRTIALAETKRWSSKHNTLNKSLFEIKDEDKSSIKVMMDFYEGNARFRAEYLGKPSLIRCQECHNIIPLSIEQIKSNCLYQETNPSNCLCVSCTQKWRDMMNHHTVKEALSCLLRDM